MRTLSSDTQESERPSMEIHESIEQILQAKDKLGAMFYEHFLAQYPQVQPHFEKVDLKRQSVLLGNVLITTCYVILTLSKSSTGIIRATREGLLPKGLELRHSDL